MRTDNACSTARAVVAAALGASIMAACGDTTSPGVRTPAVSFAKGGPTPGGPNALPERGRIVFQMDAAVNTRRDLYSVNEDGSGLKRLTYNQYDDIWPAASRDGKKVAYVGERDATTAADVIVMNADGSQPRRLTSSGLYTTMFSRMEWSPDGKSIAVALNPSGDFIDWNIYLINASTGALTQLTSSPGAELWPTWSPDGSRLAFHMTDAGGVNQIFTMKADGSGLSQFTFCADDCIEPSWSPDGATIAHFSPGTQRTVIRWVSDWTTASGLLDGRYAVWAPDAARLVFADYGVPGQFALSTASYGGTNVQQVRVGEAGLGIATWLRK